MTGVSAAEFQTLQRQFLDLRHRNYELQEELCRKEKEVVQWRDCAKKFEMDGAGRQSRSDAETIDYQKRELELLLGRMQLQEEEFQLQQLTMQRELSKLMAQNQELNDRLKSDGVMPNVLCNGHGIDGTQANEGGCDKNIVFHVDDEQLRIDLNNALKGNEALRSRADSLLAALAESREKLQQLSLDLQEAEAKEREAMECLRAKTSQLETVVSEKEEFIRTADKRKELLEEMALYIEEIKSHNEAEMKRLKGTHEETIQALRNEIRNLTAELTECKGALGSAVALQPRLSEANAKIVELETVISEQASSAKAAQLRSEETFKKSQKSMQAELNYAKGEHDELKTKYDKLQADFEAAVQSHQIELSQIKEEHSDKLLQIRASQHRQHSVIQDLKKQLRNETKRADRLQEKLGEILKDVHGYVRKEDLKETCSRPHGDTASNSSWSLLSGIRGDFDKLSVTCSDQESVSSVTVLENEIQELVDRVASLRQSNSELTERVHILEETSSKLAEDLSSKNAMIEQLLRDRRSICDGSGLNPKSLLEMVRIDLFDSDVRCMNKKLQRMLEETLTKNMYLQKNIETLSQELMKVSSSAKEAKATGT